MNVTESFDPLPDENHSMKCLTNHNVLRNLSDNYVNTSTNSQKKSLNLGESPKRSLFLGLLHRCFPLIKVKIKVNKYRFYQSP